MGRSRLFTTFGNRIGYRLTAPGGRHREIGDGRAWTAARCHMVRAD